MAHIKIPQTNWLDSAWEISAVLEGMPSGPANRLAALVWKDAEKYKGPTLNDDVIDAIEGLLIDITLRLAYRLQVHHKAHKKLNSRPIDLENRDPKVTLKAIKRIESGGVVLDTTDFSAFDAHIKLSRILIDGYVSPEWKRTLPLLVASISGATTSQTATLKATQPRKVDRRSTLSKAVSQERRKDPHATAMEVLDRLCGGDVVKETKGERVWYWDKKDVLKDIGLDRFETIFGEQKPSTG